IDNVEFEDFGANGVRLNEILHRVLDVEDRKTKVGLCFRGLHRLALKIVFRSEWPREDGHLLRIEVNESRDDVLIGTFRNARRARFHLDTERVGRCGERRWRY